MATTTLPVTIAPEAAAHVAELGLQREFDMMLERIRKIAPGLRSITVTLAPPYDTGDEFCVLIEVVMDNPHKPYNPAVREWGNWKIQTFSPDVHRHFVLLATYGHES
jgi:hypothetical protein